MIKRKLYGVIETSSRHVDYDLAPQTRTNIYGVYTDIDRARKGLKDCLDVVMIPYSEMYGHKEVSSVIVKEPDYALVVKVVTRNDKDHDPIIDSEMITIKIVTMK